MKFVFLLCLSCAIGSSLLAQPADAIRYGNQKAVKTVHEDGTYTLELWHHSGEPLGEITVRQHRSDLCPTRSFTLRQPNGVVYQSYDHDQKVFENFNRDGSLESRLWFDINADSVVRKSYYTSGQVHTETREVARPGDCPLAFNSSRDHRALYFRLYSHVSGSIEKHFYPNGVLLHRFENTGERPYSYTNTYYLEDGTLDDSTYTYFENRKLIKQGTFLKYSQSGYLREVEQYRKNLLHGLKEFFHPETGQIQYRGYYKNGKREGPQTLWYDNGDVKSTAYYMGDRTVNEVSFYENGRLHNMGTSYCGLLSNYDDSGKLQFERFEAKHGGNWANFSLTYHPKDDRTPKAQVIHSGQFRNGLRDGRWQAIDKESGRVLYQGSYANGLQVGEWEYYGLRYRNEGKIYKAVIHYNAAGLPHGEYMISVNDIVLKKGRLNLGVKIGLWETFNDNGLPKRSVYWNEDRSYDERQIWHDNGQLNLNKFEEDGYEVVEVFDQEGRLTQRRKKRPGDQYAEEFDYDESGYLKRTNTPHPDGTWTLKTYYPSGAVFQVYAKAANRKFQGPVEVFHENGQLKIRGQYANDRTEGEWYYYDEVGTLTETRTFRNGNRVYERKPKEQCWCEDKTEGLASHGFANLLKYIVELEDVNAYSFLLQVDSTSFHRAFARNIRGQNMDVMLHNDAILHLNSGVKVNLTPCRKGNNSAEVQFSWNRFNPLDRLTNRHHHPSFTGSNLDYYLMTVEMLYSLSKQGEWLVLQGVFRHYPTRVLKPIFRSEFGIKLKSKADYANRPELLQAMGDKIIEKYRSGKEPNLFERDPHLHLAWRLYESLIQTDIEKKGLAETLEPLFYEDLIASRSGGMNRMAKVKGLRKGAINVNLTAPYVSVELPAELMKPLNPNVNPVCLYQFRNATVKYSAFYGETLTISGKAPACQVDGTLGNTNAVFSITSLEIEQHLNNSSSRPNGGLRMDGRLSLPTPKGKQTVSVSNVKVIDQTLSGFLSRPSGWAQDDWEGYIKALQAEGIQVQGNKESFRRDGRIPFELKFGR